MTKELKYREILLSDDIKADTVSNIINEIITINYDDNQKEKEFINWERKPINLYINSVGGSCYDGLALVDIIKQSKTPVHTISIGSSMSMGFWIYLAGHKRFIGEHSTLMFHDVASWTHGKTEQFKQELEEMLRLQKMYCDMITNTSLVKQEALDDYIFRKAEWYIPAEKAIELKLADAYYKGY